MLPSKKKLSFRSPSGDDIIINVDKRRICGIAVQFAPSDTVVGNFETCNKSGIQETSSSVLNGSDVSQSEGLIQRCISWDSNMQRKEHDNSLVSAKDNCAGRPPFLPSLGTPMNESGSLDTLSQGFLGDSFVEDENLQYDDDAEDESNKENEAENGDNFLSDIQHLIVSCEALSQQQVTTKDHNAFLLEQNKKLAEQLHYLQAMILPRQHESSHAQVAQAYQLESQKVNKADHLVEPDKDDDVSSIVAVGGEEARTRHMLTTMVKRFLIVVHERNQLKMQLKDLIDADLQQTAKHAKESLLWEKERQDMKRQLKQHEEYTDWLTEHQSCPKGRPTVVREDASHEDNLKNGRAIPAVSPTDSNGNAQDVIAGTPHSIDTIESPPICQRMSDIHLDDPSSTMDCSEGPADKSSSTTYDEAQPVKLFQNDDSPSEQSCIARQATMQTSNVGCVPCKISHESNIRCKNKEGGHLYDGGASRLVVRWDKSKSPFRSRNVLPMVITKGSPVTEISLAATEISSLHESWGSFPLSTREKENDNGIIYRQSPKSAAKVEKSNYDSRCISKTNFEQGRYPRNKTNFACPTIKKQGIATKNLNSSLSSGCSTSSKKNKSKSDQPKRISRTSHTGHPELHTAHYQPLHNEESTIERSLQSKVAMTSQDALQITARGGESELAARKDLQRLLLQAYSI